MLAPLAAALGIGHACSQIPSSLPTPACPGLSARADPLGPPSARAGKSSLKLQVSGKYVTALLKKKLTDALVTPAQPAGDGGDLEGADIQTVKLVEMADGLGRRNLVTIQFSAWLRGADGGHVYLPGRTYTLRVRLEPLLITPEAMGDAAQRRGYLQCDASESCNYGLVVVPVFDSVVGGGARAYNAPVDCKSSDYDFIDQNIMQLVLASFACNTPDACVPPFGFPLDSVLASMGDKLGANLRPLGIDLGTDGDLVVGLLLSGFGSSPFDNFATGLARSPDVDWALQIDTTLLVPAIQAHAVAEAKKQQVTIAPKPTVEFLREGIRITAAGSYRLPVCGDVAFTGTITASTGVCGNLPGGCVRIPNLPDALRGPSPVIVAAPRDDAQGACISGALALSDLRDAFASLGKALTGQRNSDPKVEETCFALGTQRAYRLGDDFLYPSQLDTDEWFVLKGRSLKMDALNRRPPATTGTCKWPPP